jgi:hypothetical protein
MTIIKSLKFHKCELKLVCLRKCGLQDSFVKDLLEKFNETERHIVALDLSQNHLTSKLMTGDNSLANFLTSEMQDRLETLILEHNRDIGDVGLIELTSALM